MTRELLATFRDMVNEAIRICLKEGIRGRLRLRDRLYRGFQERYGVGSCFPYSVAEVAWSIVKKHRQWQRIPFAEKLMMKMDSQNYSLTYSILSLPFRKGERVLVSLQYGDYHRSFLMNMDTTLERGSVTITEDAIIIAFGREIRSVAPFSRVGVDSNEKAAVLSDGTRYDLSETARLHTECGVRWRDFCQKHLKDRPLKKKFAGSRREKERVRRALHATAKKMGVREIEGQVHRPREAERDQVCTSKGNGESRAEGEGWPSGPSGSFSRTLATRQLGQGSGVEFVGAAIDDSPGWQKVGLSYV